MAAVVTGRPARREAMRAMFIPCSASGMAQPMITSSISSGARPLARAIASLITTAARSSGRVLRRAPLGALPTAVRTELTMTASRMNHLVFDGIGIARDDPIGCQHRAKCNRGGGLCGQDADRD